MMFPDMRTNSHVSEPNNLQPSFQKSLGLSSLLSYAQKKARKSVKAEKTADCAASLDSAQKQQVYAESPESKPAIVLNTPPGKS